MSYDKENIFAKIIRGEIPCDKIYEDDYALSFEDIRPQAPSHALIIPKGEYTDVNDFSANASNEEIVGFNRAIAIVADKLGISEQSGGNGYRLIANAGKDSHQEVPHLHFHLLAGRPLGPMVLAEKIKLK
jgi:histidine triad (HIT) family protein|tara:strand:+ start:475 stop:864 length:390 start_codon:yes stop_codon:yes gene_type:complete